MSVIARSRLLGQRLRMLERRRADLVGERAAAIRAAGLPAWAGVVMQRVGMTANELAAFDRQCARRAQNGTLDEIDAALTEIDRSIADAEEQLLACDVDARDRLEAMADVAVQRLRRVVAKNDDRTGADEGRALGLLEELLRELQQLREGALSRVG